MNILIILSLIGPIFWAAPSPGNSSDAGPGWHVLLIAVGDYPRIGGWDKLSSGHDADLLEESLRARGMDDIQKVVDEEATKAGILAAFENLTARAQPGDMVFIHYSGHGQQVWDHDDPDNPQRHLDEIDGFDESLVPYDARDSFSPGVYEGENHLIDDEINLLLTDLRTKLGAEGQLLFTVDACFSGSISRSANLAKVRGTKKVIQPEGYTAAGNRESDGSGLSESFVSSGQPLANLAVISAARADQPNYETTDPGGNEIGSLSLALSRTMVRSFDRAPSLGTFFRYVETDMASEVPYQSPQLEGDANRQLFGNSLISPSGYPVLEIGADQRTLSIRGGTLAGLFPGTTVSLVREGNEETSVKGEVRTSDATTSSIALTTPLPDADPVAWFARVEDRFLLFNPVKLALEVSDPELARTLQETMANTPRLDLVEQGAQLLLSETDDGTLILSDVQEKELARFPASPAETAANKAMQRIEQYARARFFWNFGENAATSTLEIETIPVSLKKEGNIMQVSTLDESAAEGGSGIRTLALGDPFIFKVRNRGPNPSYIHIIGVDADDSVYLLMPDDRTPPADLVIGADTSLYLSRPEWIFETAEPVGKQLFVVFGSNQPIDLRPVFRQNGRITRGAAEPEQVWLNDMLFGRTRSAGLEGGMVSASALVEIKP